MAAAPTTTTAESPSEEYVGDTISNQARIIFIVVGIIYMVVGVVGNILIIVTIAITKTMRNPHFYFIVNLALGDLLITSYVLPHLVISFFTGHYPAVNFRHCVFNGFIIVCAYVSSLLSLMVISINRYLSVCHSQLFSRLFSNKMLSSVVGCAVIWFLAIMSTLPCLFGWGRFVFDRKTHYCGYDRTYSFGYTLFLLLFSIGIPVVVVFVCNFAIWRFVRQASHRIYAMTKGIKGGQQSISTDRIPTPSFIETNYNGSSSQIRTRSECEHEGDVEENIPNGFMSPGDDDTRSNSAVILVKTNDENNIQNQQQSEAEHPFPVNPIKVEMQYLKPWDGTSSLIGLEMQEIRTGVRTSAFHRTKEQDKNALLDHQRQEGHTSGPSPTKRHRTPRRSLEHSLEPQTSSGVLVTPDELALIKTVFVIFIAFAVFMMPYMMSTLLDVDDQWSAVTHITCSYTSFTNSCLNCILYGLMTPAFKKAYKKLFHCWRQETLKVTQLPPGSSRGVISNRTDQTEVKKVILGRAGGSSSQSIA